MLTIVATEGAAVDVALRARIRSHARALIRCARLALSAADGNVPEMGAGYLLDAHADACGDIRFFRAHSRE